MNINIKNTSIKVKLHMYQFSCTYINIRKCKIVTCDTFLEWILPKIILIVLPYYRYSYFTVLYSTVVIFPFNLRVMDTVQLYEEWYSSTVHKKTVKRILARTGQSHNMSDWTSSCTYVIIFVIGICLIWVFCTQETTFVASSFAAFLQYITVRYSTTVQECFYLIEFGT